MALSWENTKVDGEAMRLYVGLPVGSGPFPALVVIQHQGGVDEFVQDMVKKATSAGYVSVAPDLYHRDPPDCQDDGPTRRARLQDVNVIKDVPEEKWKAKKWHPAAMRSRWSSTKASFLPS